jgi:hypothetical protein
VIVGTTTRTGLTVRAEHDTGSYPRGIKITDRQMRELETQITRHAGGDPDGHARVQRVSPHATTATAMNQPSLPVPARTHEGSNAAMHEAPQGM